MAVKITGKYLGNLRVQSTHPDSGTIIETDAPVDNHGQGARFSPTDTVVSALASCMITVMAIVAERNQIDLSKVSYYAEKHMTTEGPRRISKIVIKLKMPAELKESDRKKLEKTALTCPVHHSLSIEIIMDIGFEYTA
jgi:putative redox protein